MQDREVSVYDREVCTTGREVCKTRKEDWLPRRIWIQYSR